jgi:hypothetical protein
VAQTLDGAGIDGGRELRALVFLVIGVTVVLQGLSGGLIARLLGLRRPRARGYAILGANDLGRALGRALRDADEEVVFLESNHDASRAAEEEGFRVVFGSGLTERSLQQADLEGRAGCMAVTTNDELNLLFAREARDEYRVPRVWVALRRGHVSVTPAMVGELGARLLFAQPRTLDLWMLRLERGFARVERWRRQESGKAPPPDTHRAEPYLENVLLPLVLYRGSGAVPVDEQIVFREGDELAIVVFEERRAEAEAWREENGWVTVDPPSSVSESP